jgi:hypothetical protein
MDDKADKDWKLKLKYGKFQTPYHHFTVLAEGTAGQLAVGFSCPDGKAWMGMKVWASSSEEAADMIQGLGANIGFNVTGRIHVYTTEPVKAPKEDPFGYDIYFTPFEE